VAHKGSLQSLISSSSWTEGMLFLLILAEGQAHHQGEGARSQNRQVQLPMASL